MQLDLTFGIYLTREILFLSGKSQRILKRGCLWQPYNGLQRGVKGNYDVSKSSRFPLSSSGNKGCDVNL